MAYLFAKFEQKVNKVDLECNLNPNSRKQIKKNKKYNYDTFKTTSVKQFD